MIWDDLSPSFDEIPVDDLVLSVDVGYSHRRERFPAKALPPYGHRVGQFRSIRNIGHASPICDGNNLLVYLFSNLRKSIESVNKGYNGTGSLKQRYQH